MHKTTNMIYKELKKRKKKLLFDIIIKNYDDSNFYIGMVFDKNIEKYEILFVPVDLIQRGYIENYFCFQFVFLYDVDYLLKLADNIDSNSCSNYDKYYVEINNYHNKKKYSFKQFIDRDCEGLFDFFVTVFQYVPNYMNDLVRKILIQCNSDYCIYKYNDYYSFDLLSDNLSKLFTINDYTFDFLEKIGNMYYGILENNKYIIEYSNSIIRLYCDNYELNKDKFYSMIVNIRNNKYKNFCKLNLKDEEYKFLCYGVDSNNNLLIINNLLDKLWSLDDIIQGKIVIDSSIEDFIDILNTRYSLDEINDILLTFQS